LPLAVSFKEGDTLDIPKPKRARNRNEYSSYVVHTPYDKALDQLHPGETQLYVLQQYLAGLNWLAADTRNNPQVIEWRQALECAKIADASCLWGSPKKRMRRSQTRRGTKLR